MKNQNDLILVIVSVVVALAAVLISYFTKPERPTPPAPTTVNLSPAVLPEGSVVRTDALPGGTSGGGGGGGAGGRGGFGGAPSAGGAPGGGGAPPAPVGGDSAN